MNRSGFPLRANDQLRDNRWLAATAHGIVAIFKRRNLDAHRVVC